ncbi:hypothetical protein Drorol1_Dr00010450 [Drosera rotundifolia]
MGHPRFAAVGELKRKRGGEPVEDPTETIYNLIESRGDKGIWKGDVKKELNSIKPTYVDNYINKLSSDGRIKEFVPKEGPKGKPLLVAMHIEPAEELTGGIWYDGGKLDEEFIAAINRNCLECIKGCVVASAADVLGFIKKRDLYKVKISLEQIKDVLGSLVLDNVIAECKSTGFGEFARIPVGTVCYKLRRDSRQRGGRAGAMALIPCGACPRINQCTPNGAISPVTCVYFDKWLALEF